MISLKKKLISTLLSAILLCFLILPVSAQSVRYVTDHAGLLTEEEITSLEQRAAALLDAYDIHAAILTTDSLGGSSPQDYADDYYDASGYGDDGVLFLISMEERDWYISTCGSVRYALTDYGIQQIGENTVDYFSYGLWYDGFDYFLSELPVYLDALEQGAPIDGYADYSGGYYHGSQEDILYYEEEFEPSFLLSLLCGLGVGGITVLIMRLLMNTKRPQRAASEYMTQGSWDLYNRSDLFLYSKVSKTRRQESNGSGGGSSVHRSSSGRSHGGGGGKF